MKIVFHKNFKKQYKKLRVLKKQIDERLVLFIRNPFSPFLNNHALKGKYLGYRSINVTGDLRAIYKLLDSDTAIFIELDKYSNLYR